MTIKIITTALGIPRVLLSGDILKPQVPRPKSISFMPASPGLMPLRQVGRYDDVVLRVSGSKTEQTRVISRRDIIMALPFETRSIVLARRAIGKC